MDILTLLDDAERAGLTIRLEGDRIHIAGPREAANFAHAIGARKPEVLAAWWSWQARRLIRQVDDPDVRSDLHDLFDERFAIAATYSGDDPSAAMLAMGELIFDMIQRGIPVRVGTIIGRERVKR
jgi:hypothetical protein